jgi:UDP-N-acetylglucosamine 2-epimerase (non-hydrolysing)
MKPNQQLADLTAALIISLDKLFRSEKYTTIVVQGDTTTAMTAAITSFYLQIPVAHIEAGLRTHNLMSPFPEEMNRQVISRIASWTFAPTERAAQNLQSEGCENVYVVGNTVIDSLLLCKHIVEADDSKYQPRFSSLQAFKKLVLVTGHRRENFSNASFDILEAIKTLSIQHPEIAFYYPVHLSPMVQKPVTEILGNRENIILDEPLNYDELVYIMRRAHIILTDSGGIQEEAPSFGIPIIVLRDTTERPEGISNGCAILAGTNKSNIIRIFNEINSNNTLYHQMSTAGNPYGDGTSSAQIADIFLSI